MQKKKVNKKKKQLFNRKSDKAASVHLKKKEIK